MDGQSVGARVFFVIVIHQRRKDLSLLVSAIAEPATELLARDYGSRWHHCRHHSVAAGLLKDVRLDLQPCRPVLNNTVVIERNHHLFRVAVVHLIA